jgi:hypothetical protein
MALGPRKKPEGHITLLLHPLRVVCVAAALSRLASVWPPVAATNEHGGKNSV